MRTETATLEDGRRVEYIPEVIGEGGFKRVYFTKDKSSVVCFFKDQSVAGDRNRLDRLDGILGKFNPTTHPDTGKFFAELFCWPTGIITRPQFGIMTPAYPKNFFFAEGKWKGQEKNGKWFASPKLRKLLPASERGNWRNYVELCLQMARGVRRMHLAGLAHSDLSCNNILIDPPNGRAVIIDVDSLVVPGIFPPDVAGTPGYIAPEVIATMHLDVKDPARRLPCNYTDMHALAVLIYEYLLRRHPLKGPKVHHTDPTEDDRISFGEKALFVEHPTDSSNRPQGITVTMDQLGPLLKGLFVKAFVDGLHDPPRRPTAAEWESALAKTTDLLVPCDNPKCEDHWFVQLENAPAKCPWCGTQVKQPFPVLDFFYAPKSGQYRPENHRVVGHHDRPLYKWHIHTNVKNVEAIDAEPQATILLHQGKWILLNRNLVSLIAASGNPVSVGQACLLNDGEDILLSKDERGRLVCVRMVG